MNRKMYRLFLSAIPSLLAFFLVWIFAMVLMNSDLIAALAGLAVYLTSTVIILRY